MNLEDKYLNDAAAELFPIESDVGFVGPVPPAEQEVAPVEFNYELTPESPEEIAGIQAGRRKPASVIGAQPSKYSADITGGAAPLKQLSPEQMNQLMADPSLRFNTVSEQMKDIFNREQPSELISLDRTMREELSYQMQQTLVDKFGIDNYKAGRLADTLFGGDRSGAPLGLGLIDITPFTIPLAVQESGISAGQAKQSFERGDYGQAALEYGTGILQGAEAVPGVNIASKMAKGAAEALGPTAANMMEAGMRKTGMIADIVPDGKSIPKPEGLVSSRLPTAVNATEDPLKNNLLINLDAAKQDPKAFDHNVNLITQYPNFVSAAKTPDLKAEDFINTVKDNLLYLYDKVPAETRNRSMLWYDGARNIADKWAKQYNIPDQSVAGILAVLSPQKDWFMNVSLGNRVIDIMSSKQAYKWDNAMSEKAKEIWAKPQYAEMVKAIEGKQLSELTDTGLKAMWLRTYDQAHLPREHQIVTPEGNFAGVRLTDKGAPYKTGWGSLNEISKAINIFENPTVDNISANLGSQHKVRSFYNNIYAPNDPSGNVTIDTHAVAAGLLRPLSGNSREVAHNFGSNVKGEVGPKNSSITGSQGTYGIYAEAYKRAAEERGVLPRQMQSITWEAVRGLFQDTFKTPKNAEMIDNIWLKYKDGKISLEDARNEIVESAGGITAPEWERAGLRPQSTKAVQSTNNKGELSGVGVSGGDTQGLVSGERAGVAGKPAADVTKKKGNGNITPVIYTKNFRNWFGKSAIVESSGTPQKMYHATSADIEEFRPGNTIYVSPSPKFAESYGGTKSPNIMPLYVKAEKPFNYENASDVKKLADAYKKLHGEDLFSKKTISSASGEMNLSKLDTNPISQRIKSGDWTIIEDKKVQAAIKKAGFDAFYIEENGIKNLGVYSPTQLKSTFNKGEFNPKDPRLLAGALPLGVTPEKDQTKE